MPTTSVIIPTHNRPQLLRRAVESARTAGADVEVVVIDDASTDQTAELCRSLTDITYVRAERNQGVAGARNLGLVASHGEYVTFLDDDDIRLPGSLERQIEMLEREPDAAMIYGRAILGDEHGQPTDRSYPDECPAGDLFWKLLTRNFIPCGTVVFRRECLTRIGLLDDQAAGIDDWDLWVRISEICSIISSPSPVTIWRRAAPGSDQGSSQAARLVLQSARQFREQWMKLPRAIEAPRQQRRSVWIKFCENMGEHLIWESARALARGRMIQPLANLSTILRLHPATIPRIAGRRLIGVGT